MKIEQTSRPRRSPHPPREGVPVPTTDAPATEQHWRKHPSDYHADFATSAMNTAAGTPDSYEKRHHMQAAEVHALLSVRDALLETAATYRECMNRLIDHLTDPKE